MFYKVATFLSLVTIISGSENEPQPYAVSSQSFHREDIPVAYKHSTIHKHSKNRNVERNHPVHPYITDNNTHHIDNSKRYGIIQYAPLPYDSKFNQDRNHHSIENHRDKAHYDGNLLKTNVDEYTTENNISKNHLEPQLIASNLENHKQGYRSFLPGYNVFNVGDYKNSKTNKNIEQKHAPKMPFRNKSIYPEGVLPLAPGVQGVNTYIAVPRLSKEVNSKTFHEVLAGEKPLLPYQHISRIHLNIGRNFNIAKKPYKPPSLLTSDLANNAKPPLAYPALTQAFFLPDIQKTIMYPVQSDKQNNLITQG